MTALQILAVMIALTPAAHVSEVEVDRWRVIAESIHSQTASLEEVALVVTITRHESGHWSRSVHSGRRRGDGGESVCLGQLRLGDRGRHLGMWSLPKGQRGKDLIGVDRAATDRCVAAVVSFARYLRSNVCKVGNRTRCVLSTYLGLSSTSQFSEVLSRWRTYRRALRLLHARRPTEFRCVLI